MEDLNKDFVASLKYVNVITMFKLVIASFLSFRQDAHTGRKDEIDPLLHHQDKLTDNSLNVTKKILQTLLSLRHSIEIHLADHSQFHQLGTDTLPNGFWRRKHVANPVFLHCAQAVRVLQLAGRFLHVHDGVHLLAGDLHLVNLAVTRETVGGS